MDMSKSPSNTNNFYSTLIETYNKKHLEILQNAIKTLSNLIKTELIASASSGKRNSSFIFKDGALFCNHFNGSTYIEDIIYLFGMCSDIYDERIKIKTVMSTVDEEHQDLEIEIEF